MFTIANNYEIRISRGDDSGAFPIYLNQGSITDPNLYQFKESLYVGGMTGGITNVILDKDTFKKKCPENGLYSFYYLYGKWHLFDEEVELADYGLTCIGKDIQNEASFSIINNKKKQEESLRFYILEVNAPKEEWLVRKTFYKSGEIITEYPNKIPNKIYDSTIIDSDGNMKLRISGEDTEWLRPGMYNYFVTASISDNSTKGVAVSTVTKRYPLYIIDDDFDREWG